MPDTLSSLAKKYNGFVAPGYSIIINNTDLSGKFLIEDLRIELTSGYESSGLAFKVKNGFENGANYTAKLNKEFAGLIKPGSIAEASIGYGAGRTKIFHGYVDNVYMEYNGANEFDISVECLDAKGIMMNSRRSEVKKDVKKYSEAVRSIFDSYPKLITKQSVDKSPEVRMVEQYNESDYDFIVRISKKINYRFYILNGEAVFSPSKSQATLFKIMKSDLLKSFTLHTSLKRHVSEVIVRSGNEEEPSKPFSGKATEYKSAVDGSNISIESPSVMPKKTVQTYIDHSVSSEEEAKSVAEAHMSRLSNDWATGKLECIGIPELVPGKVIEIEGFGEPYDRTYYVNKAMHVIGEEGYVTQCELGVDAP